MHLIPARSLSEAQKSNIHQLLYFNSHFCSSILYFSAEKWKEYVNISLQNSS